MTTLLIVGANSHLAKNFLNKYRSEYEVVLGIDVQPCTEQNGVIYKQIAITSDNEIERIPQFVADHCETLDRMIFFSAVNFMNDFYSITSSEWNKTIDVNLSAILFILKKIYGLFSRNVSIVFIASQNGVVAHDHRIDYGVSKAGLIHLAKELCVDFSQNKEKFIRVNAVSPSYILCDESQTFLNSWRGKRLLEKIPYRRFVEPEDVSCAIQFLLSDQSRSICGHNLILDYGYTLV